MPPVLSMLLAVGPGKYFPDPTPSLRDRAATQTEKARIPAVASWLMCHEQEESAIRRPRGSLAIHPDRARNASPVRRITPNTGDASSQRIRPNPAAGSIDCSQVPSEGNLVLSRTDMNRFQPVAAVTAGDGPISVNCRSKKHHPPGLLAQRNRQRSRATILGSITFLRGAGSAGRSKRQESYRY